MLELNGNDERKPIYSVLENDETWLNHPPVTYSPTNISRKDLMFPRDKLTANISHEHDQLSRVVPQTARHSRVCTERRRLLNKYKFSTYWLCSKLIGPWHLSANVSKCFTNHHFVDLFPVHLTTQRNQVLDNRSLIHKLIISRQNQTL